MIESLETNVFLEIGCWPIHEVTAPELLTTMRKVEKRGALDVAQRVMSSNLDKLGGLSLG